MNVVLTCLPQGRGERWAHYLLVTLLILVTAYTVVMVAVFGPDFFVALAAGRWSPVDGYLVAIVLAALQVLASLVLLVRHRYPGFAVLFMLSVMAAALVAETVAPQLVPPLNNSTDPWIPLAISGAMWGVGYYGLRGRTARLVWLVGAVIAVTATRLWSPSWGDVAYGVILTVAPALFGLLLGYRKRYVDALRERAWRAEREQILLAEQARADERVKLAGEMHDVVTHRLSLMVLQAGALGVTAPDAPTRAAAEELRAAGCQALEELRDLIGVLRSPADEQEPDDPAGVPSLAELVDDSRAVGLRVSLAERGDRDGVSPVVGRTAYRIVQEALTNVHKHAPGADAEVTVDYERERLRLRVHNSPPCTSAGNPLRHTGSGTGLDGLRRRVELVSGSLQAAATAEGGFVLDATLPTYVPTAEVAARG